MALDPIDLSWVLAQSVQLQALSQTDAKPMHFALF
jgi:hypothetical protein